MHINLLDRWEHMSSTGWAKTLSDTQWRSAHDFRFTKRLGLRDHRGNSVWSWNPVHWIHALRVVPFQVPRTEMICLQVLAYRRRKFSIQKQRWKQGPSTQQNHRENRLPKLAWILGFRVVWIWCGFFLGQGEKGWKNPHEIHAGFRIKIHSVFSWESTPESVPQNQKSTQSPHRLVPSVLVCSRSVFWSSRAQGLPENALNRERVGAIEFFGAKKITKNLLRWCGASKRPLRASPSTVGRAIGKTDGTWFGAILETNWESQQYSGTALGRLRLRLEERLGKPMGLDLEPFLKPIGRANSTRGHP